MLTVNGASQSNFRPLPWSVSAPIPPFNVSYARLQQVSYSLYAGAEVHQFFNNPSGFNNYENVNGSATVDLSSGGAAITSAYLFPFGSGVITPHSSGTVYGFDSTQPAITGSLPTSPNPGILTVSSTSGSGPSLETLGSVQVIYTYTPIGLVQTDPILPASTLNEIFTFTGVPSARWFDPPTTSAYRYDMTSAGDSFTNIINFPTGFLDALNVDVNGVDYGEFSPGETLSLPAATRSFTISGINPPAGQGNPTGFPLELAFNRNGVTFTMTPVPEPTTLALETMAVLLLLMFPAKRAQFSAVFT